MSVKGGENVGLPMMKEFITTVTHNEAEPTKPMLTEAAAAGFYTSANGKKYPRLQILTIADLLSGKARAEHPDYEPNINFKKAKTEKVGKQEEML